MALDISNRNPEYYENRFEQRYKMACKCMVQIDGEQFNGEIADISFNGVAFILEHYWGSGYYRRGYRVLYIQRKLYGCNNDW